MLLYQPVLQCGFFVQGEQRTVNKRQRLYGIGCIRLEEIRKECFEHAIVRGDRADGQVLHSALVGGW